MNFKKWLSLPLQQRLLIISNAINISGVIKRGAKHEIR